MTLDEERLWSRLQEWGFPLQEVRSSLIDRFSSRPTGSIDGERCCQIPTRTPLDHLLHEPWHFRYGPDERLDRPTFLWNASVRQSNDPGHNLAMVVKALTPQLGVPVDSSAGNTRARTWWFGHGGLQATVWPPELNPGSNARYESDPGARTECSLQLFPCWRPGLTAGEAARVQAARCVWRDQHARANRWPGERWNWGGQPRQLPPALVLPAGVRELRLEEPTGDLWGLLLAGVAWSIPRREICALEHSELWPARGPGGAWLSIEGTPLVAGDSPRKLGVWLEVPATEARSLREAAQELAESLSVPLRTEADYDT